MKNENFLYANLLETLVDGMATGNRNNTIVQVTDLLQTFGVQKEKAFQLVEFMNDNTDEPLDQSELRKTFMDIWQKETKEARLLKVLKNIAQYPYTKDENIKETLDARLMVDCLELAEILGADPEDYIF